VHFAELSSCLVRLNSVDGLGSVTAGCRTYDREVVDSTPIGVATWRVTVCGQVNQLGITG